MYRTCRWNCRNEWNLTCRDFISVDTQTVNQPRYTFPLQRSKGYSFAVHAETIFGNGENSTISFVSRPYAGDIPNLRVDVYRQIYLRTTNIMRIRWDAPSEIDAKDIQVPAHPQNQLYPRLCNRPSKTYLVSFFPSLVKFCRRIPTYKPSKHWLTSFLLKYCKNLHRPVSYRIMKASNRFCQVNDILFMHG